MKNLIYSVVNDLPGSEKMDLAYGKKSIYSVVKVVGVSLALDLEGEC